MDLMIPRYKVIADYPNSDYKVGEVFIKPDGFNHFRIKACSDTEKQSNGIDYSRNGITQNVLENFSHIFKRLEWWEERKPEEMPEYVKANCPTLYVFKFIGVSGKDNEFCVHYDLKGGKKHTLFKSLLPATKEERTRSLIL